MFYPTLESLKPVQLLLAGVAIGGVVGFTVNAIYGKSELKAEAILRAEKERLLKEAVEKLSALNKAQRTEIDATSERAEYLVSINKRLQTEIDHLSADLSAEG